VAVYSAEGKLLACTYLGGSSGFENMDGLSVDAAGNVLVTAATKCTDYPVTDNAFQKTIGGGQNVVLSRLSADLKTLLYSTYIGGKGDVMGRNTCILPDGSLVVVGLGGEGWPTRNAYQPEPAAPPKKSNAILARFAPAK
jgi:hypothetical protein